MVFHFPPISGGGVVVIVELANKFAELGHDVTILTPNLDWRSEKYEPELNEKILIHKIETVTNKNGGKDSLIIQINNNQKKYALELLSRNRKLNIDKEFTLVNRPFEPELGDDIEVELPTETVVNEDGSVDVGPEDVVKPEMGFGSNLVEALSDDDLAGISSMVLEKVEEDMSKLMEIK